MNSDQTRRKELAMIHLAKQQLQLDDEMYRDVLRGVCGVSSSADLDADGRRKLLAWFRDRGGWASKRRTEGHPGKPHNFNDPERGPYFRKIEAFLAEARRPWAYADGMVKRMFRVDRLAFCTVAQLRTVIAAMKRDAERNGRRTA